MNRKYKGKLNNICDDYLLRSDDLLDLDETGLMEEQMSYKDLEELKKIHNECRINYFDWKEVTEMAAWVAKMAVKYKYFYSVDEHGDSYIIVASNYLCPNATKLG